MFREGFFRWLNKYSTDERERDFKIEWRDQSIRRLEALLSLQDETITRQADALYVLRQQLDETCRRKGLRDEENNKLREQVDILRGEADHFRGCWNAALDELDELRGEVDGLKTKLEEAYGEAYYLNRFIESLVGWLKEKDEMIERQAKEIEAMRLAIEDDQIG